MLLKKQIKESSNDKKGLDDSVHEMNELIESDEEQNAADAEGGYTFDGENEDSDTGSLWDSDEERT